MQEPEGMQTLPKKVGEGFVLRANNNYSHGILHEYHSFRHYQCEIHKQRDLGRSYWGLIQCHSSLTLCIRHSDIPCGHVLLTPQEASQA